MIRGGNERCRQDEPYVQALARSLPDLVFICHPDGACEHVNARWVEYTGIAAEAQLGDGWLQQVHPDDRAVSLARAEEDFQCELRLLRRDQTFRRFAARVIAVRDARGQLCKWLGQCIDVQEAWDVKERLREKTEQLEQLLTQEHNEQLARLQAEQALQSSEQRLLSVVANMSEGLIVADSDGLLTHWNPAAREMHGFDREEDWKKRMPEFLGIFELSTMDGNVLPLEEWPMSRILRGEQLRRFAVRVRRLD